MKFILKLLILTGAVLLAAYIVPGITVTGFTTALIVAIVLALINIFVKPVLRILTLPINILSLGLFGLILNVILFWAVAYIVSGFTIAGFIPALWGAVIVGIASWIADWISK